MKNKVEYYRNFEDLDGKICRLYVINSGEILLLDKVGINCLVVFIDEQCEPHYWHENSVAGVFTPEISETYLSDYKEKYNANSELDYDTINVIEVLENHPFEHFCNLANDYGFHWSYDWYTDENPNYNHLMQRVIPFIRKIKIEEILLQI